jgi:hypothetical protein
VLALPRARADQYHGNGSVGDEIVADGLPDGFHLKVVIDYIAHPHRPVDDFVPMVRMNLSLYFRSSS